MMDGKRYWFRKKKFGWGWAPATSEGWIATLVFISIIAGGTAALIPATPRTGPWAATAWNLGWTAAFIALAAKTGEPLW